MNREHLIEYIKKVSDKYPNIDFTHFIPKESKFKKLFKKDITIEEYSKICNEILDTILQLELKRFPYVFYVSDEPYTQLASIITNYNRIKMCTEIKGNTFKYYPISIDKDTSKILYTNVMRDMVKTHIETGEFIEFLIPKKIEEYKNAIESYKDILRNTTMMPYYGDPIYITKHSKYILESAKKLGVDTSNLEILIQKLEDFNNAYPIVGEYYPYFSEEYKMAYRNLEETYLQILKIEKSLMPINAQKWQDYLTKPENHTDKNFKYLVHAFTGGFVPPSEMSKACTTLVTNSLLAIPYGTFGLIYDFDYEAVDTICTEDAGSWTVTKADFIDNGLFMNIQLQHPEKNSVFYECENTSKLVSPQEVEQVGISNNLKYNNNQPFTYDSCVYTEIFLNNKAKPCGVFYTDDCKNIQEVLEYAKKYNLPVVHLSLQKLRLMNQKDQMINGLLEQLSEDNKETIEENKTL